MVNVTKNLLTETDNLTEIYTDGGYSMKRKEGFIAYKIGERDTVIEQPLLPDIKGLKQYTNLLELWAIKRVLDEAQSRNIIIKTDSQTAQSWFERENNNLKQFSNKHYYLKAEIDRLKRKFDRIGISWIPRDQNLAGVRLEEEQDV